MDEEEAEEGFRLPGFLQWQASLSACHWFELIAHRVRQEAEHFRQRDAEMSRAEQQMLERDIIREIVKTTDDPKEQVQLWMQRTGKKKHGLHPFGRRQSRRRETRRGGAD